MSRGSNLSIAHSTDSECSCQAPAVARKLCLPKCLSSGVLLWKTWKPGRFVGIVVNSYSEPGIHVNLILEIEYR